CRAEPVGEPPEDRTEMRMLPGVRFQCGETEIDIGVVAIAIRYPDFLDDGAIAENGDPDRSITEHESFDRLTGHVAAGCAVAGDNVCHERSPCAMHRPVTGLRRKSAGDTLPQPVGFA